MSSYENYDMVRSIKYVLDDTSPPKSIVRSSRIQFWFWLVLNIIVSFLISGAYYFELVAHYVN
jgi:hypothetical protein